MVSHSRDIIGLVFDSDTNSVEVPRVAWFLDVGANKVRSLSPDSVKCLLEAAVD